MRAISQNLPVVTAILVVILCIVALLFAGNFYKPASVPSGTFGTTTVSMPPVPVSPSEEVSSSAQVSAKPETSNTTSVAAAGVCTGAQANVFECYQDFYTKLVKNKGIAAAFSDLKA